MRLRVCRSQQNCEKALRCFRLLRRPGRSGGAGGGGAWVLTQTGRHSYPCTVHEHKVWSVDWFSAHDIGLAVVVNMPVSLCAELLLSALLLRERFSAYGCVCLSVCVCVCVRVLVWQPLPPLQSGSVCVASPPLTASTHLQCLSCVSFLGAERLPWSTWTTWRACEYKLVFGWYLSQMPSYWAWVVFHISVHHAMGAIPDFFVSS